MSHGAQRIEVERADLLAETVDAIVNAANEHLRHGGGLARAIADAAGPQLTVESRRIGYVPTGEAVATTAGQLPQRYVLHTPGPVWHDGGSDEPRKLAQCHRSVIELAAELGLVTVAFPAISCGIFGYPVAQAAPVAVAATAQALDAHPAISVRFCLLDDDHVAAFSRALDALHGR